MTQERRDTPRGDEWWAEMDKIDAVSVYGGRVTPYDGVYHVYLAETNCSLWRFKTYEEARDKLLWALNKGGYCDEDNPLKELERLRAMQSETLFKDAAPQPSTAALTTAPSQEGVGHGDVAAAAPSDDKKGDVDVPMIEAACAELLEMSGIDLGGDEMRRVLQAALAKAPQSASATREQGLEEAAQLAEAWDYPLLAADIRKLTERSSAK